ncbi:MAG: phage tail sheath family protein [Deltaproteobacteria bacterium]|nr:phage tail sheath family protein [Deltaproteobacteria bacterium]
MGAMKTPGVYIVEKSAFPNSVVEVGTAIPAFIGYTAKADNKGKTLRNKPWRITSMAEYLSYFGGAPVPLFDITEEQPNAADDPFYNLQGKDQYIVQTGGRYFLYYSMLLFFQNGGGPCYIVSVGNYKDKIEAPSLIAGIGELIREQEPTMVVVPDAVLLDDANCISVQQAALAHCNKMKNRFSILDVWGGFKDRQDPSGDCVDAFRDALGINYLDFSAAYYPWINTTVVQDKDITFENIANRDVLCNCLRDELKLPDATDDKTPAKIRQQIAALDAVEEETEEKDLSDDDAAARVLLNKSLIVMSPLYNTILKDIKNLLNLLPPSGAMAGIYTMVDSTRGVWKAPANVSLASVVSPAVNITHDDQEDLNVTTQGKSINAIRSFIGEGTLVWGARTLDGNSLDWRYINVRRTMIMLEESIKLATKAYVFEPNDANTWVTVKSMIRNFLTGIWKRGGLAGASPEDAFSVSVGLNETMTPEDILEGIMRVTVLVAISRPAEFIEITFQQQMQKS